MPHDFVLVHGAWHGGWCWQRLTGRLRATGHNVFAPTLAGLSGAPTQQIGLKTHIDEIVELIGREALNNVVLVGHSYAGFVISGVAERILPAIRAIVFLDAFYPDHDQALIDMGTRAGRDAVLAALERGEETVKPFSAEFFKVNERDRSWVNKMCKPHPIRTFIEPISLSGKREQVANKAYIRAVDYPSAPFDDALSKVRDDRTWRTFEMQCGHDAMIDMPDRLSQILIEIAEGRGA